SFITGASLQTPHVSDALLLEHGSHVRLGHIVGKGAIAENAGRVASRRQGLMPLDDSERKRLHFVPADCRRQAHDEDSTANRVDILACNGALLNRDAKV